MIELLQPEASMLNRNSVKFFLSNSNTEESRRKLALPAQCCLRNQQNLNKRVSRLIELVSFFDQLMIFSVLVEKIGTKHHTSFSWRSIYLIPNLVAVSSRFNNIALSATKVILIFLPTTKFKIVLAVLDIKKEVVIPAEKTTTKTLYSELKLFYYNTVITTFWKMPYQFSPYLLENWYIWIFVST